LPDLAVLRARDETFDLIMLTGVWMHLDAPQRRQAMPNLASLLRSGGLMIMKVRHGPVPSTRLMFAVPDDETIELAQAQGLELVLTRHQESIQEGNRRAGVTWTRLAFAKARRPSLYASIPEPARGPVA
jgi:Methyltransferase domain